VKTKKYGEKNMKNNVLVFGATLISILMASSITAVTMPLSDERLQLGSNVVNSTACVQPGIYLSGSEQRKILSDSLSSIDDPDVYQLVQAIITKMDYKGFVDSYDIQQIVNEDNLEFVYINYNTITTGDYPNPGWVIRVGHPFRDSEEQVKFALLFWVARHSYDPARDINIIIHDLIYQYNDHRGWAIGFSGTYSNGEEETGHWFTIHGSALLFIIKPPLFNDYNSQTINNQQINPTPQSQPESQQRIQSSGTTTESKTGSITTSEQKTTK